MEKQEIKRIQREFHDFHSAGAVGFRYLVNNWRRTTLATAIAYNLLAAWILYNVLAEVSK